MSKIKELTDAYLKKHYQKVQDLKDTGKIKWSDVAKEISYQGSHRELPDPEYVRKRFLQLKKAVSIGSAIGKSNEVFKETFKTAQELFNKEISKFQYSSGKENKEQGTKEFHFTADTIPTEDEIIEHFNIDIKKFKISQIWHKTTPSGKYSISVNLQALKDEYAIDFKKEFEKFIENYNVKKLTKQFSQKQESKFQKKTSVLLNLSDLHVGKLAWDKEVGSDYNVDLAKKVFLEALKNLVYQSVRCFGVEEFILNIGGDFFHTNGSLNQTANGTNMNDVDTRYQKIYIKGLEILTEAIDFLASFEGVKVKLYVVQGNHDKATSFYLGESLKAFYRKEKDIEIVNDPHIRKYHKYGVTSYMLTHGDCKDDGLPLTFATEKPDYFASSEYRYIFLGHLHKSSRKVYLTENEVGGVVSRRLNSLSVMDAWHNENNYYGAKRMANALIFDKDNGQVAEFNYIVKK